MLWPSQYRRIAAIKRRSPGAKVLVYKDMASTRDDAHGTRDLPTGVGYSYANRRHPEWFLRDTNGHRVNWADWPHYWQMDVGNRAYQRAWTRASRATCAAAPGRRLRHGSRGRCSTRGT